MSGHEHGHGHEHARKAGTGDAGRAALEDDSLSTQERWEGFYADRGRIWSGRPNALLVEVVSGLAPGRALDLGCGEGGDSLWLAAQGWTTTAVDVAPTALARTREAAAAAGLAVTTEQHDLERSLPVGPFDLVSAFFLQSPVDWDRAAVLRRAAGLLAPGGVLVVVDHGSAPSWSWHAGHDFPTAAQVHEGLALPAEDFEALRVDAPVREAVGPQGQVGEVVDLVVVVRRRG